MGGSAFTLIELLVVLAIVAVLSLLLLPVASGFRARAQRVQCMTNLRSLYSATELFIQQNGSWPQIDIEDSESQEAAAWITALKPFGANEKTWICPTIQNLMQNPDYTKPENTRVDYIACSFDDKPTSPHEWARQPWFAEVADVHGHGNLIIFTDGSISDLKTAVANQRGK